MIRPWTGFHCPAEAGSAEAAPPGAAPAEIKPKEAAPSETPPGQRAPAKPELAEPRSPEGASAEGAPPEPELANPRSREVAPAETELAETGPSETEPPETATLPGRSSAAQTNPTKYPRPIIPSIRPSRHRPNPVGFVWIAVGFAEPHPGSTNPPRDCFGKQWLSEHFFMGSFPFGKGFARFFEKNASVGLP
jgi:hypothetical protein